MREKKWCQQFDHTGHVLGGGGGGGGGKKKVTKAKANATAKEPVALPTSVCAGLAFVSEFARRAVTSDPEICIGALDA